MDIFRERLRELRGKKSQEEIAKAIGITPQSLGRYEKKGKGGRKPDIEVLKLIAKHFNVSADYLLGLSEIKTIEPDINNACNVTGLNEDAIKKLQDNLYNARILERKYQEILNLIFTNNMFYNILVNLYNYSASVISSDLHENKHFTEQLNVEDNGEMILRLSATGAASLYEYRIIEDFKKIVREIPSKVKIEFEQEHQKLSRTNINITLAADWKKNPNNNLLFKESEVTDNGEHNTQKE